MTAASAVGPSSHGTGKTRWSLAHSMSKPSCSAVLAYPSRWPSVKGWPPKSIRGRCAPNSTALLYHKPTRPLDPDGRHPYHPRRSPDRGSDGARRGRHTKTPVWSCQSTRFLTAAARCGLVRADNTPTEQKVTLAACWRPAQEDSSAECPAIREPCPHEHRGDIGAERRILRTGQLRLLSVTGMLDRRVPYHRRGACEVSAKRMPNSQRRVACSSAAAVTA